MVTRNVVLTDSQSALVDQLITSGRYQNASEALRAGLRLLEREEAEFQDLRSRLMVGLDQARRGDLDARDNNLSKIESELKSGIEKNAAEKARLSKILEKMKALQLELNEGA